MARANMARVRAAVWEYIEADEQGLQSFEIKTVLEGETEFRMFLHYIAAYSYEKTGVRAIWSWTDTIVEPKQLELELA